MIETQTPPPRNRRLLSQTLTWLAPIVSAALLLAIPLSAHAQRGRFPATSAQTSGNRNFLSPASPTLVFAGKPLPVPSGVRSPYRDPEDGMLCVAPESLAPLGITFKMAAREDKMILTSADGATVTVTPRVNKHSWARGVFVPVVDVVEALGGKCQWDANSATLYIRAVLKSVEIIGGQLRVRTTLPVIAKVTNHPEVQQAIVDLYGAEIGNTPHSLSITAPNVGQVRCGQFDEDTTRIVLEMTRAWGFLPLNSSATTLQVFNPAPASRLTIARANRRRVRKTQADVFPPNSTGNDTSDMPELRNTDNGDSRSDGDTRIDDTQDNVPTAPVLPVAPPLIRPKPVVRNASTTQVREVALRNINANRAQLVISAGRVPKYTTQYNHHRLTLTLLNTTFAAGVGTDLEGAKHPLLNAVQTLAGGANVSKIVLDLSRIVVYSLRPTPAGLVLDLALPRSAGGTLAGKTIVVDAGHGGHDSGAIGIDHSAEKNINLAMAMMVTDVLRDAGANVIMTRSTDTFVELDERAAIANRAHADFFISVHADSEDRSHAVNGSTVYSHFQVASCRALASSIADRLADIGGIRCKGVRSDGIRFPKSGFAVLRLTRMVGVLVECGYMTNSGDVKRLQSWATRQRTAKAIMLGLRDYIEGNPDANTRTVNPPADDAEPTTPALSTSDDEGR